MKKKILFNIEIFFIITILLVAFISTEALIDPRIIETFNNGSTEVLVTITLNYNPTSNHSSSIKNSEERKKWMEDITKQVAEVQDKIIPFLKEDEFRLKEKSSLSSSFSGWITQKGLERLRNDHLVGKISYAEKTYASEDKIIDSRIQGEFDKEKDWVNVVIYLKDNSQKYNFISSLSDEINFRKIISRSTSEIIAVEVTKKGFNHLINDENVKEIHLNSVGSISLVQSAPLINATSVWNMSYNGTGVKICVIDSGVNKSHSSLTGKIVNEYCYCSITDLGSGGCCPDNTDEDNSSKDDNGHGTHVAATAAAKGTFNGTAPDAKLIVMKYL